MTPPPLRLGLLGLGAMGRLLLERYRAGSATKIVAAWDPIEKARSGVVGPRVAPPEEWAATEIDLLIEVAHPLAVPDALTLAGARGWDLVVASVGGLLAAEPELQFALDTGCRVLVPSGAIGGLDLLRAIPKSELTGVTLTTRKPPHALPPSEAAGITEATCLFAGTAREAIARFPKNINVAVTLSLAGLGANLTRVELWADPAVERNTHEITIRSGAGDYTITCANVPLEANPATSRLALLSIIALIESQSARLRIGS